MPNLNKVLLMGNLTRDPELRYTNSNQAVCNIGLAINRQWTNKQTNEKQQETTFIDCEAWGKSAETINQYLRKGNPVYLEGRLKLDQWENNGEKRSKVKIVVENFQFLNSGQQPQHPNQPGHSQPNQNDMANPHDPIPESDIPF